MTGGFEFKRMSVFVTGRKLETTDTNNDRTNRHIRNRETYECHFVKKCP